MTETIKNKGLILNIQRMSTEDGPGIRTTVFFKGCSLSCKWCHNPESISWKKEIQWIETRCIGCNTCINKCQSGALSMTDDGIKIDRAKCILCLSCANECPTLALEVKGEEWELQNLVDEVIKDRAYFGKSGGGVTVSGGEALLQPVFVSNFLEKLKGLGIHTAVDTCGMCSKEALQMVLPYTDLVLYDIKLMDPKAHDRYTGQSNERILDNISFIAEMMKSSQKPKELWIRTPIIPGATANTDNIKSIGSFITLNLKDYVSRWDLCAFNNLCRDKYRRMDMEWMFSKAELMEKEEMENLAKNATESLVNPEIVHWSGAIKTME